MPTTVDDKLWESWVDAMGVPGEISRAKRGADRIDFEFVDDGGTAWNLPLRTSQKYTVGIDLVGFSQRTTEGQLLLTAVLFSRLDASLRLLRRVAWLSGTDPSAVIPTGDGALLVFDSFNGAFATILTLHMFLSDVVFGRWCRVNPRVDEDARMRTLPFEVRYALASGELVPINDVNQQRNYVGEGLVRVSRILAASKGAHFLVDDRVMAERLALGGINAAVDEECRWGQQFHVSRMLTRQVKSSQYEFYNVFGFFDPTGLMKRRADVESKDNVEKKRAYEFADTSGRYEIGSHDVTAIP